MNNGGYAGNGGAVGGAHPSNTLPSFLQHDPFAFAGGANTQHQQGTVRQRTLSAGNNAQSLPNWAGLPSGLPNGTSLAGAFSPFGAANGSHQNGGVGPASLQGLYSPPTQSPYGMPEHAQHSAASGQLQPQAQQQQAASADDVIPTAIVIKNIPFAFPSTSLLQIIEELTLAPPYAFNYHYDNGTFRGLAFANFHTPQETDACVAALNGFEINGRKLRVEYKKVLQAGEKERIERDKAIKRMRSMQLERERLINQHQIQAHQYQNQQQQLAQFAQQQQQQPYMQQQQQQQAQQSNNAASRDDDYEDYGNPISTSYPAQSIPQQQQFLPSPSIGGSSATSAGPTELDMNDPVTLEIYSRVLLFKDDALRDELAFSRALTPIQRRVVHLIAQRLGLEHRSVGTGEDRFVVIVKPPSSNGDAGGEHRSLRTRASAHGFAAAGVIGNGSLANRKKSMPDLRHQQSHPSNPPIGTMPQLNTANLASLAGFGAPGSLPFLNGNMALGSGGQGNGVFSPALPLTEDPHAGSGAVSPAGSNTGVATRHSNHDLRRPRSAFYGATDFASVPPVPALPPMSATSAAGSGSIGSAISAASMLDLMGNTGNKVVGSPVSANSAMRQPKGPDGQGNWARVAGAPPGL